MAFDEHESGKKSPSPAQHRILITAATVLLTLATVWLSERLILLTDLEQYLVDYRLRNGRLADPDARLIFVSVDQPSYAGDFPDELIQQAGPDDRYFMTLLRGSWPWSREVWGHLSHRLIAAGAKGVLLDFVFPSEKPEDAELKAILDRHAPKVIVGALIDHHDKQVSIIQPTPTLIAADADGGTMSDPRVGLLNLRTDGDGVVRRAMYSVDLNQFVASSLGTRLEAKSGLPKSVLHTAAGRAVNLIEPAIRLPPAAELPVLRYAGPSETLRPISIKRLIDPEEWRTHFAATGFFKDKFVIIGPGSAILNDDHRTPFNTGGSKMIGSEVRLNQINAALHGEFLTESSRTMNRAAISLAGLLALTLTLGLRRSRPRAIVALALSIGFVAAAIALANGQNYLLTACFTPLALFNGTLLLTRLIPTSAVPSTSPPGHRTES